MAVDIVDMVVAIPSYSRCLESSLTDHRKRMGGGDEELKNRQMKPRERRTLDEVTKSLQVQADRETDGKRREV